MPELPEAEPFAHLEHWRELSDGGRMIAAYGAGLVVGAMLAREARAEPPGERLAFGVLEPLLALLEPVEQQIIAASLVQIAEGYPRA